MLNSELCFSLLKSCGPPNDIISFFGPRLKKFADLCLLVYPEVNAREGGLLGLL